MDQLERDAPRDRIAALLAELASEIEDVEVRTLGTTIEYHHAGTLFAVLDTDALEVMLGPDIASAATRTADTGTSDRGAAWVRFAPRRIDRFAMDRAGSWFEAGWIRAEEAAG